MRKLLQIVAIMSLVAFFVAGPVLAAGNDGSGSGAPSVAPAGSGQPEGGQGGTGAPAGNGGPAAGNGGPAAGNNGGNGGNNAAGGGGGGGGCGQGGMDWKLPALLLGAFVIMYIIMGRSRKKQEQKRKDMLNNLKKGDKVITIGGIVGTVIEAKKDEVRIKVDETSNTRMTFARWAIRAVGDEVKTGDNANEGESK